MKSILFLIIALLSFQALAQRYEIGNATKTIEINKETSDADLMFKIPLYRIEERVVVVQVTCRIPVCSTEEGDGSSGNWHGFFNVTTAEKPAALAAAIKGIGKAIAEKIVDHKLFTHKPDSWSEFKSFMFKIEKQLHSHGYNYRFATQVTEQFGYDNMIALGYGNEQSCRTVETTCDQVVVREERHLSHYIDRHLDVVVKNQSLQSFETDTVKITVGSEKHDVSISASGHNKYTPTLMQHGSVLELEGKRIMSAFPIKYLSVDLNKDAQNNFVMSLNLPSQYNSSEDEGSSLHVTYELCRADWFGGCYKVVGGPWSNPMENNTLAKTFTTASLKKGSKYFVRVRVNKLNSRFYSDEKSDRRDSKSIRL